jgi:PTS system mannose-specific IID component
MSEKRLLNFWDLLRMFFRSFFIQAVWNYHSLLSIGLCYSLLPAAKRIYADKAEQIKFLCRHLNFFNAHPYFASFAIGAIVRVEEEQQVHKRPDPGQVERLKNALIGPLGAIGDQLFWANIKPSSVLVAVLGIVVFHDFQWQLLFLAIMLVMYNIPHFYVRITGIFQGYRLGVDVYKVLNLDEYKNLKKYYGAMGAVTLGCISGFSFIKFTQVEWWQGILFLGSMVSAYSIWKWRQNFYQAVLFSLALILLLGIIIEVL